MVDVRRTTTGFPDYTGQLQLETSIRVIDRNNGPSEVGDDAGHALPGDGALHGHRRHDDRVHLLGQHDRDAVLGAGTILEGKRTVWQLGQVRLNDGGADGVASTTPNSPFMVQGVMVP